MMRRFPPALVATAGATFVWLFFAITAGTAFRGLDGAAAYLNAAAPLGILAVTVALLMIAGEFDLSVGSILGAAGMSVLLLTRHFEWALWPAIGVTFIVCGLIGLANGWIVVRTRLPSFIVTLGTLFIVRGATIGLSRQLTGRTQLSGLDTVAGYEQARLMFASDLPGGLRISIVWWLAVAALAAWVLARTRAGNWIRATGGAPAAARNAGVPIDRTKITLFVLTALAACLVGVIQAVRFTGADALRGEFQEFRAIVAVVIGGTLLTGGHGTALGAVLGALIFGMVQQGTVMTGIDADWFQVILGTMLVLAVLSNDVVRRRMLARAPAGARGSPVEETPDLETTAPVSIPAPVAGEDEQDRDAPVLEAREVSVQFDGVIALDRVSLELHAGRVTCLLGDNGAGKSTLIHALAGVLQPAGGHVAMAGRRVQLDSPRAARRLGIAAVYQDLALAPLMSVWRNVVLGVEPVRGRGLFRRLDVARARHAARRGMTALGIALPDVSQPVGTLSGGERQGVAIARAMHAGARVLILDEPTAALGVRQQARVLDFIARARSSGLAVLLVTHNPAHAWPVGDSFVILRLGRVIAVRPKADTDPITLAGLMSGE
ncbi:MAG: ATP-binding cassette domain-containing protein [Gemmatimonadetes bacterium]|nr:ATP-binding cassette domain-containing protein [Gemmatimonadota bacterium]